MKGIKIFVDDMVYRMIQAYSCALSHNCYDNCSLYRISAKHYPLLLTCWMCYSVFVDVLVRWRRVFFFNNQTGCMPSVVWRLWQFCHALSVFCHALIC